MVHVQDTGCGITKDDLERLFTRFGKLENSNRLNKDGIGLGLTIVRGLIYANQGQIQMTSNGLNQGTKVIFSMSMTSVAHDELSENNSYAAESNQSLVNEFNREHQQNAAVQGQ